jgi:hypothetical protein
MQTTGLPKGQEKDMSVGAWIPVIAIISTFAVPIVAIVMDFRRRKLQYEERRAMIERGMTPPPLETEPSFMSRTQQQSGERSLRKGIILLCLGLGLGLAAFLLGNVLTDTFIPAKVVGPLAVGASVVGFIGLGNLVYYAVAGKREERDKVV